MKLSLLSYSMSCQPKYFDVNRMFVFAGEVGFDGIDMVTLYDRSAEDLRTLADDHGIPIVCHTICGGLGNPDPVEGRKGFEEALRGLDAACVMGARVVMFPPFPSGADRAASRKAWLAGLARIVPCATALGLTVTVEHFPGVNSPFVLTDDMLEAVEKVPGLKICFDTGNALAGENPVHAYRRLSAHVGHFHFKDYQVRNEPTECFFPMLNGIHVRSALIGGGVVDFPGMLHAMKMAGYHDFVSVEYDDDAYSPEEGLRRCVHYIRSL